MPRSGQGLKHRLSQVDLLALLDSSSIIEVQIAVQDLCAGERFQLPGTGYIVLVAMGLQDVGDPQSRPVGDIQVDLTVPTGIDDRGPAGPPHQVR